MKVIISNDIILGINNKVDPTRIKYNPETGVTGLEDAQDVLIDQYGGLSTRRGSDLKLSGVFHSCYPTDGNSFYAVKDRDTDAAIGKFTPQSDGSLTVDWIRDELTKSAKVSYCLLDGKVYYMNGFENGYLDGSKSYPWTENAWPRATTDVFIDTPVGEHFDLLSSRFIIAKGNEIVFTETGLFGLVNNAHSYRRLESKVLMVYAVGTGVFLSDEKAVYWCAGRDPNKWIPEKVLNYPAIAYCRYPGVVDPSIFGFNTSNESALFGTVQGPVIGFPDGNVENLIYKRVVIPKGYSHGSIMVVDETTIIQSGA